MTFFKNIIRLSVYVLLSASLSACSTLSNRDNRDINSPTTSKNKTKQQAPVVDIIINADKTISSQQNQSKQTTPNSDYPSNLYICDDISPYVGTVVGRGECVDLLKTCANVSHTSNWAEGGNVWNNKIPSGTAIATFKNGVYPNQSGYHAAIYISQDDKGIYVWDQWRGKEVHSRLIRNQTGGKPSNTAQHYRVIRRR